MIKIIKKKIRLLFHSVLPFFGKYINLIVQNKNRNHCITIKGEGNIFFGYYDISPIDKSGSKILFNYFKGNCFSTPKISDYLQIGYFDLKNQEMHFLETTDTWCWQQGCRLQYYPSDSNNKIIFNKLVNNKYGAVIYDIDELQIKKYIDFPLYTVSSLGDIGLSLNFSRLQRLRPGYGYTTLADYTQNLINPLNDGVFLIDIDENTSKLLVSLDFLANYKKEVSMEGAEHYVNHLLFSPDNSKFLLFHVWNKDKKRFSRPFIYTLSNGKIELLDNNSLAVSHYTFKSSKELLLTIKDKTLGLAYKLYNLEDNSVSVIDNKYLKEDSHPSFVNSETLLFDSYPNYYTRIAKLSLVNLKTNNYNLIDTNFHPNKFTGEYRCDLHPRLNQQKGLICIDTVKKGKRVMKLIPINK